MKVLSLFDGISCGMVALEKAGIQVDEYVAYEIDESAIKVSKSNYAQIVHCGNVIAADFRKYKGFDLLIGGSPCQGFSYAGKGLNFNDPRSKLFFEFVRALKEVQPKYFLLENVVMKKEWSNVITEHMEVEPVQINSSLVSAQNRERLYWTNIPFSGLPEDKDIMLADVLEDVEMPDMGIVEGKRLKKATIIGRRLNENGHREDYNKDIPITQCLEVRKTNTNKSNCLTTVEKDNVLTPLPYGRHIDAFKKKLPFRYLTAKEYCRLQTLPDDYTREVSESAAKRLLGNAWTVDIIVHILSGIKEEKQTEKPAEKIAALVENFNVSTGGKSMDKVNIEITCMEKSKVTAEELSCHILRAVAGVTANNKGIVSGYSAEVISGGREE